jgi:uncharacterized membrane protein
VSVADELQKLADLRASGAIDDEEYERAKECVLGSSSRSRPRRPQAPGDETLGRAANRFVSISVIWGIIGLVVMLLLFFLFFLPQWNKHQDRFDKAWDDRSPIEMPRMPGR